MPPQGELARADLVPGCRSSPRCRSEQVRPQFVCILRVSFRRTNMADLVRGDGGGFMAGSLVALLAVFGIFFLTLML